jgi:pimeloyl-ACP methyl ester carboxylesterase
MISENKKIVINNLLLNYYGFSAKEVKSDYILLFLHGWQSSADVWNPIAEYFAEIGFNCLTLDLPGFGNSQKASSDFDLQDYSEIVDSFLQKLGIENLVLVGHSFGGAVSIKLTSTKPKYLKKLILVDSSGIRMKSEKMKVSSLGAKILKPIFAPNFMHPLKRRMYRIIGNEDYLDSGELKGTYLNVIEEDLSPLLSMINLQTLIVWGERDSDTPLWMAQQMNEQITDSKLEVLENGGHFSFLDNSEEFKDILKEFLQ